MRRGIREQLKQQMQFMRMQNAMSRRATLRIILISVVAIAFLITTLVVVFKLTKKKDKPTLKDQVQTLQNVMQSEIIGSEGELTDVVSTPNLSEIININQLRTISYRYNSICEVRDINGPAYYMSYEGNVYLGIDMNRVNYSIDERNQYVRITLPPVRIVSATVAPNSIDYIFIDDSYNTPETGAQAQGECQDDLEGKVNSDWTLIRMAREATISEVTALFNPIMEQYYPEYSLIVEYESSSTGGNNDA